jgi:hypothetical protein
MSHAPTIVAVTQTPTPARRVVVRTDEGWEIHEHRENTVVRLSRHTDWHKVERWLHTLELNEHARQSA